MDLFGEVRDTLNNGTPSCLLDALTTIANILAIFVLSLTLPAPAYQLHNCVYFSQIIVFVIY
jgi:hypothetical protein